MVIPAIFGIGIVCFFIYCVMFIFSMILHDTLDKKKHWSFYMKKNVKYDGKVDPIYEVIDRGFYNNYKIIKWELGWERYDGIQWLLALIIYPINIYMWKYREVGNINIGDSVKLKEMNFRLNMTDTTIIDEYEFAMKIIQDKADREEKEKRDIASTLKRWNKEFDENYE